MTELLFVILLQVQLFLFGVTADDPLLWVQHLDRPGVSYCCRTTYDDNAITNAVEIYDSPRLPS